MNREEQIKNMARAIHINCHKGLTSTEAEMIAKWCCQEIDRKASDVAREIFAEIEAEYGKQSGADRGDDLTYGEVQDFFAELKKKYTEDGK